MYFKSTIRSVGHSCWALAVCLATLGLGVSATADAPRRSFIRSTLQTPPQLKYTVIDLGVGVANAIDGPGRIVGSHLFGAERHAAFWRNSQSPPIDLGTLPGFTSSFAADINPRAEIVGAAGSFPTFRPLFWASSQSGPVELPGVPVGLFGVAFHINPVGQIVGWFLSQDFSVQRAVFWPNNDAAPIYLPELSNELPHSIAAAINASGDILGDGCDADFVECHAAFWASSTSTPVALASPGGQFIYTDIGLSGGVGSQLNNAGRMVGFAYNADFSETRAVFWASITSPAVILSTAEEFINGGAEAISDKGQIVGEAYNSDFSDLHAFMWPTSSSPGIDLNTVIPPDSGLELLFATGVNNRSEITGLGILNGEPHAYVLIPVHSH
jgi:probable HAF family extracellular repeat protein